MNLILLKNLSKLKIYFFGSLEPSEKWKNCEVEECTVISTKNRTITTTTKVEKEV